MDRRKFLQEMIYGGTATWLATQTAPAQSIFISGLPHQTPFIGDPLWARAELFSVQAGTQPASVFTLGAASGDPAPDGIVLWTRVDPRAVISNKPQIVAWEIATAPGFAGSQVLRGAAAFSADTDYTVKIPIRYPALRPFTTYYYRFIYNGTASRECRFKTLPAPGASVNRLRIGYISCQDYTNGYYTALAHLANEDIDFVVHLGDYIYESTGDPRFQAAQVRKIPNLPSGGHVAASLEDYRFIYRTYKSDPFLQVLHDRFSFIQIWDDHEFQNDAWREYHPDNNANPLLPRPELRKQANRAWAEYVPANVPFHPELGPSASIQLYRSFEFGDLMELVATDERLYRDGLPCGLTTFQRYGSGTCAERERLTRTMLGDTQRNWFVNKIRGSRATWKIWANEIMIMQLKALNLGPLSLYLSFDQWDGYPAERARILRDVAGTRNFVAITGDLHSYVAGYLKADYEQFFSLPVGVEFVGGSVSSSNLTELLTASTPVNSAPVSRAAVDTPPSGLESFLRLGNAHIQYFNSSAHGYVLLDLSHSQLTCTMKQVSTIRQPAATGSVLRTFVVYRDLPLLFER